MTPKPNRKQSVAAAVVKHRACDECRTRKLACSKQPDGCSRCMREGIRCHYSPQKPMGRPRKRRTTEKEGSSPSNEEVIDEKPHHIEMDLGGYDFHQAQDVPIDPSLNFLDDPGSSSLEFLDLLPNHYTMATQHGSHPVGPAGAHGSFSTIPFTLSGVDLLGGVQFNDLDPSSTTISKDLSDSLQYYLAEKSTHHTEPAVSTSDDSILSDPSNSVGSPGSSHSSMRSVPTVNCGCLSSLYLAIDSLSNLPNDVMPAMRIARNASRVAHDVINCSRCSMPLIENPAAPPPIQCFQNLMGLGALVPSACNAYAMILEMVDRETILAKQQGRTFFFTFKDVGGLWGQVGTSSGCPIMQAYNDKNMQPDMWRSTIRALLRLDVYGVGQGAGVGHWEAQYKQQGLKDVVALLEERSRKRHALLDELMASGQLPQQSAYIIFPNRTCRPEERNCMKVIESARVALDNLIIP